MVSWSICNINNGNAEVHFRYAAQDSLDTVVHSFDHINQQGEWLNALKEIISVIQSINKDNTDEVTCIHRLEEAWIPLHPLVACESIWLVRSVRDTGGAVGDGDHTTVACPADR